VSLPDFAHRQTGAPEDLTGIWQGLYTYPDGASISFVATLIDSGGALTGSTHEPHHFRSARTVSAMLEGSRDGRTVSFVKTYQDAGLMYAARVKYQGTLSSDATEIEGRWTIWKIYSGKFMMIRPAGKTAEVEHKQSERV
jgi:hypothetical protein